MLSINIVFNSLEMGHTSMTSMNLLVLTLFLMYLCNRILWNIYINMLNV